MFKGLKLTVYAQPFRSLHPTHACYCIYPHKCLLLQLWGQNYWGLLDSGLTPPKKRQPLRKDLQFQRKVTEASTQHLLLVSLCVQRCMHVFAHTQMNSYELREKTRGKRQYFEWILSWGYATEQSSRGPAQPVPHRKAGQCCSGHLRVFSTEWSCVLLQIGLQHSG